MNTYIDADSKTLYLEVEIVEGTTRSKILTYTTSIARAVSQVTTSSPDPSQEFYNKAESHGLFRGTEWGAGEQLTLKSPSETYCRTLGIDDSGNAIDIIYAP